MTIIKDVNGSNLTLMIDGRIDATTAPQLEAELTSSLVGMVNLILDLKNLTYISSAGLRVLLVAQKQMMKQGAMRVINVCDAVMDVFDMTGFSDILTIE